MKFWKYGMLQLRKNYRRAIQKRNVNRGKKPDMSWFNLCLTFFIIFSRLGDTIVTVEEQKTGNVECIQYQ